LPPHFGDYPTGCRGQPGQWQDTWYKHQESPPPARDDILEHPKRNPMQAVLTTNPSVRGTKM
jgi:hypothetical protein